MFNLLRERIYNHYNYFDKITFSINGKTILADESNCSKIDAIFKNGETVNIRRRRNMDKTTNDSDSIYVFNINGETYEIIADKLLIKFDEVSYCSNEDLKCDITIEPHNKDTHVYLVNNFSARTTERILEAYNEEINKGSSIEKALEEATLTIRHDKSR